MPKASTLPAARPTCVALFLIAACASHSCATGLKRLNPGRCAGLVLGKSAKRSILLECGTAALWRQGAAAPGTDAMAAGGVRPAALFQVGRFINMATYIVARLCHLWHRHAILRRGVAHAKEKCHMENQGHQKHFGNSADLSSFVMSGWPSSASVMSISFLRISIARVTPPSPLAARP